jgi:hypothetical protein
MESGKKLLQKLFNWLKIPVHFIGVMYVINIRVVCVIGIEDWLQDGEKGETKIIEG